MSRTSLDHTCQGMHRKESARRALWDPLHLWVIRGLSPHSVPSLWILAGPETPPSADMRPILSEANPQIPERPEKVVRDAPV